MAPYEETGRPCCEGPALTPLSMLARPIHIEQLDFGFTLSVGCQKIALRDINEVTTAIQQYLRDPQIMEEKWMKGPTHRYAIMHKLIKDANP